MDYELEVCTDCLMAIANDDYSGTEEEDEKRIREALKSFSNIVPGKGYDDCDHDFDNDDDHDAHTEECETITFSKTECELCRSPLGGSRHVVTAIGKG